MVATGTVWINDNILYFDNVNHFTGSNPKTITLPGRTGYTRTWSASKRWNVSGPWYSGTVSNPTSNTYSVYISSAYIWPTTYYYNTEWRFNSTDTINHYRLTYTANDGTLSGGKPTGSYYYNTPIELPTNAIKTGHTFNNFTSGGTTFDVGDSFNLPASDTTVVANWTINQYTLTYNANGGSLSGGSGARSYDYNTNITLPTNKTKTGYTFNNFNFSGTSFNLPASDTTVVANWTIAQFTVTYLSATPQYFDFPSRSNSYDYNTVLTATRININPPRVIGQVYTFNEWTYNDNPLGTTILPANNISLKATWSSTDNAEIQINELSIVFDNSYSYQNIKISDYFEKLQLFSTNDKKNVKFSTTLKGKGKF